MCSYLIGENVNDRVGIVIPSYNQGKYIEKTILSVLENKKKTAIDIALVDGGSTDETIDIVKKYRASFKFFCSERDGGQAEAINKGIKMLKECQYYMWLNSDDVFESENSVKEILEFAQSNKLDVCYGLSHFIDEKGKVIGEYPVESFSTSKLKDHCFMSQPSVMFSRAAYENVGGLNEKLQMCLDYEYWIRLARIYEFGFLKKYIGASRMYSETKTSKMQNVHLQEAICILQHYYGNVPMRWIIAKEKNEHPNSAVFRMPDILLRLLLQPTKRKIVERLLREVQNDKDSLFKSFFV